MNNHLVETVTVINHLIYIIGTQHNYIVEESHEERVLFNTFTWLKIRCSISNFTAWVLALQQTTVKGRARMGQYMPQFYRKVITYPCSYSDADRTQFTLCCGAGLRAVWFGPWEKHTSLAVGTFKHSFYFQKSFQWRFEKNRLGQCRQVSVRHNR